MTDAGLRALRGYLADRSAPVVAMLGPSAASPLYPSGTELVDALVGAALDAGLDPAVADTYRGEAATRPDTVVEVLRREIGPQRFGDVLRRLLQGRRDEATARTWTPLQELVCRLPLDGVVTTGFDSGLADARMRVRPLAVSTSWATWSDTEQLDRWLTGDVFGDDELPILYAHGVASRPAEVVLATSEIRRAYAGKLAGVLAHLMTRAHLVWIGYDVRAPEIRAIRQEVEQTMGTAAAPGRAPRHVVFQPWVLGDGEPRALRRFAEVEQAADLVLHPPDGLEAVLAELADPRFPAVAPASSPEPAPVAPSRVVPVRWGTAVDPVAHFTGRAEELARLDRWAADPAVRLVGVSAWGGAGKTALVSEWVARHAASAPEGLAGAFGWSFYADPSTDHWAAAVLAWAAEELGVEVRVAGTARPAARVLGLLARVPVLLVLDGLEVAQEGPAGSGFGRFLDPMLREVLARACRLGRRGARSLVVLTSRFPFADLEGFDGSTARMLELPAFTGAEGASLLANLGGDWLPAADREELSAGVDGHALALTVLGELLAQRVAPGDLGDLRGGLLAVASTDAKVAKVLRFYGGRLSEADRYLMAAVSLFAHPVTPDAVLAVARHDTLAEHLDGWTPATVAGSVTGPLAGLVTRHPDGRLSAHPLVRDTFRPLALGAAELATGVDLEEVPNEIGGRADGLRVVEAIELLLDADQWEAADDLYQSRTGNGRLFRWLPAAAIGQRAATAFIGTPARRAACAEELGELRLGFHVASAGLDALNAGDLDSSVAHLQDCVDHARAGDSRKNLCISLQNLCDCLARLGRLREARHAAAEALGIGESIGDEVEQCDAGAYLGWIEAMMGETGRAEERFARADRIEQSVNSERLYGISGSQWAEHLVHTGRFEAAHALAAINLALSQRHNWNSDAARFHRILGRLDPARDPTPAEVDTAHESAAAAAATFREGEYLTDLPDALTVLADADLARGDLDAALDHVAEALDLAGPRGLLPAQGAALAARGRVHLARGELDLARDDADAALRLARRHHLPWNELDALGLRARLDPKGGWAGQAAALRSRLVPPGLDPDPLAPATPPE